jgi:hypothetical protein
MIRVHQLNNSRWQRVLPETGAIVTYLVSTYGPNLAPESGCDLHWR